MDVKSEATVLNLTRPQQKMIKDLFGVTTARLDFIEEMRQWVTYRPPPQELFQSFRVPRMYLEDDQKEQIAKVMGLKADMVSDFIELDPEVIVKYMAMHKSGLLYAPPRKGD